MFWLKPKGHNSFYTSFLFFSREEREKEGEGMMIELHRTLMSWLFGMPSQTLEGPVKGAKRTSKEQNS